MLILFFMHVIHIRKFLFFSASFYLQTYFPASNSVNDVTVILLIPILEYIVYPHIQSAMGFTVRPLHKVRKSFMSVATIACVTSRDYCYIAI